MTQEDGNDRAQEGPLARLCGAMVAYGEVLDRLREEMFAEVEEEIGCPLLPIENLSSRELRLLRPILSERPNIAERLARSEFLALRLELVAACVEVIAGRVQEAARAAKKSKRGHRERLADAWEFLTEATRILTPDDLERTIEASPRAAMALEGTLLLLAGWEAPAYMRGLEILGPAGPRKAQERAARNAAIRAHVSALAACEPSRSAHAIHDQVGAEHGISGRQVRKILGSR